MIENCCGYFTSKKGGILIGWLMILIGSIIFILLIAEMVFITSNWFTIMVFVETCKWLYKNDKIS